MLKEHIQKNASMLVQLFSILHRPLKLGLLLLPMVICMLCRLASFVSKCFSRHALDRIKTVVYI